MVDDEVGDDAAALRQRGDVAPRAQPGVDLEVIDRVEARVRAVEGSVEGQQVDAAEEAGERPVQQAAQAGSVPPSRSA